MIGHYGVECEVFCPEHCGPEEIVCNGGKDYDGCPHGDFCIPSKGVTGKDGNGCPVFCPTKCDDSSEMYCFGGYDENGCEMPDFCIPDHNAGGKDWWNEGECDVVCPIKCGAHELHCYGGSDEDGCPYEDFCWPQEQENMGKDENECPVM